MSRRLTIALLLAAVTAGAEEGDPSATVRRYLAALQAADFEAAYPLVAAAMTQGQSRAEWSAAQRWVTRTCELEIVSFAVLPATVAGGTATVPVVVRSRDPLAAERGLVEERELYTLERGDGGWRIAGQQLVEPDRIDVAPTPPAAP